MRRGRAMTETHEAIDAVLGDLNPAQRTAACHGDGPLLIIAGAGTGKTTTLAHRVAWMIDSGINPGRILLLTFTRRAAAEMVGRVDAIIRRLRRGGRGASAGRQVWGGTFHAVSARLLRKHGRRIGLDPGFSILDRSDSEDLMGSPRTELNLAASGRRFPLKSTCTSIYSRVVNTQSDLETVLETAFPWCVEWAEDLKELFSSYVDRKEAQLSLDFDDLLLFWDSLMADPRAGEAVRGQFDRVLVDEYQDTNRLQASILKGLCPDGTGLTAVGDDAQSIYSFRAATVRNILDFPDEFASTTLVALEQNYRSTRPILELTNRVIAQAAERHSKTLWSERDEGEMPVLVDCTDEDEQSRFVIDEVLARRETGVPLRQQAVLFRATHHSLALEVDLANRDIPFHKYGGLRFLETAHVKDLVAFLRMIDNPLDGVAATRVLLMLPGIGPARARGLVSIRLEARGDLAAWDDFSPPSGSAETWPRLLALLRQLGRKNRDPGGVSAEVHQVRKFYSPLMEARYDHPRARLNDLEQIEQLATRYGSRQQFLAEITLDPPSSTQDLAADATLDEDYLVLSTIHSAKGLEWDTVFVIHAADGNIPSDLSTRDEAELAEELRLLYVALTRARNRLFVCHPQRYYFPGRHRDHHGFSQRSRFLPGELLPLFERRIGGMAAGAEVADEVPAVLTTGEIRRRIKERWSSSD